MPIRADCIRHPAKPVPRDYVPPDSIPYRVKDGDSWQSISRQIGTTLGASVDPWLIIRFNYPSLPKDNQVAALEVNWYLQEYVGCRRLTEDSKNYTFSSLDNPGVIYLPKAPTRFSNAPVLEGIKERRESIMANTPAVFRVDENAGAQAYPKPWYALSGAEEVTANEAAIERLAHQYNLDPDFVKATVWMESTHGWYDRLNPNNQTIRPMNVHQSLWSQLGISRKNLENPELNVAAGAHIIAAIWERTENPTPEKVATLYNQLGATKVNEYGRTVAHYMRHKPWLQVKHGTRRAD